MKAAKLVARDVATYIGQVHTTCIRKAWIATLEMETFAKRFVRVPMYLSTTVNIFSPNLSCLIAHPLASTETNV